MAKKPKKKSIPSVYEGELAFELATNPFKGSKKKKSGGKITSRMSGGQVVNAGYD